MTYNDTIVYIRTRTLQFLFKGKKICIDQFFEKIACTFHEIEFCIS